MGQKINSNFFRINNKNSLPSKYQLGNSKVLAQKIFENVELKKFIYNFFNYYRLIVINLFILQSEDEINIIIKYYTTGQFINSFKRIYFPKIRYKNLYHKRFLNFEVEFFKKLTDPIKRFYLPKNCQIVLYNVNKKKTFQIDFDYKNNKLKKILFQLRKFNKFSFYEGFINSLIIAIRSIKSSRLLSKYISKQFESLKRHNLLLNFLKRALTLFLYSKFSKIKGIKILIKGRLNGKPRSNHKLIQIGKVSLQTFHSKIDYSYDTAYTSFGTFGIKVWICEKILSI